MTCKTIFNKYTKVNLLKVRLKCIINHKAVQPKLIDMQLSALLCLLILLRTVSSSKVTSTRKLDELTGHTLDTAANTWSGSILLDSGIQLSLLLFFLF